MVAAAPTSLLSCKYLKCRSKLAISVDLLISVLKFAIHSRSDGFMVLLSGLQSCQPDPAPPAEAQEGDESDLLETRYIERNMLHVVSRYYHHLKQFGLSTPAALKFS